MQGLPPQSRTRTAVNQGRVEPSDETVVLADLFDAMSTFDWHFVTANSDENKPKPKRPKPYPRWWIDGAGAGQAKQSSSQRVARLEDARRRKREREQAIAEGRIS